MNLTKEYLAEQRDVIKRCQEDKHNWRKNKEVVERHAYLIGFVHGAGTILSVGSAGREPIELNATHALDVHPLAGEYLKKGGWKGEFKVGDCTNLPYEDKSFDVAVCQEVIEHLPDLEDVKNTFHELDRVANNWVATTPAYKGDEKTHKRVFDFYWLNKVTVGIECTIQKKGRYWYVFRDRR